MKIELEAIYKAVKTDFCNLIDYKVRGNTLEVITNVSTVSNQFVSVFISKKAEKYVVSDGGWLDKQYYGFSDTQKDDEAIISRILDQVTSHYDVKTSIHSDGTRYNYKATTNEEMISLLVIEMSNFVASVSNSQAFSYLEEKTISERKLFTNEVNNFLRTAFKDDVEINGSVDGYNEDLSSLHFNAIIRRPTKTQLLMYVSGYTPKYFIGSASEAIVNFQVSRKFTSDANFGRTAIINTHANGFNPYKVDEYLKLLKFETGQDLVLFYEDRESIFKQIRPKSAA